MVHGGGGGGGFTLDVVKLGGNTLYITTAKIACNFTEPELR
jgi:hypothetical protein